MILAGVTIATLTGDNGILTKATEASEKSKIGDETEFTIPNYINEDGNLIKVTTIGNSQPLLGNISYGNESITKVIISEGIEKIAIRSFRNFKQLLSINIPSTVIDIGAQAFYGCTSLENVEIPNGVTIIGSNAFCNCTSLTSIEIPGSVESIGASAFSNCSGLTNINIQEGVKNIGNGTGNSNVFNNCTSIQEIVIPSTVEIISLDDFDGMESLETLTLKCKCPETSFIVEYSETGTWVIQSKFNVPNLKNIYVAPEFLQGYIDYLEKYNYDTSLFKSY